MADDQKPLSDAEREAHARLITDLAMEDAPAVDQPKAILTAGQPGSGKSMIVDRVSVNFQGISEPAIIVDPDVIRPTLPYMRERIASGDLNIPGAAFQDAGTIGARVVEMAAEGRRNIIYDGTLSKVEYARESIQNLKQQNYRVEIHGMAVSPPGATVVYRSLAEAGSIEKGWLASATVSSDQAASYDFDTTKPNVLVQIAIHSAQGCLE